MVLTYLHFRILEFPLNIHIDIYIYTFHLGVHPSEFFFFHPIVGVSPDWLSQLPSFFPRTPAVLTGCRQRAFQCHSRPPKWLAPDSFSVPGVPRFSPWSLGSRCNPPAMIRWGFNHQKWGEMGIDGWFIWSLIATNMAMTIITYYNYCIYVYCN